MKDFVTDIRSNPQSPAYEVLIGEHLESHWGKKLDKLSKRFRVNWQMTLKGLIEEYKVFDIAEINGGKKYNLIKTSSDGKYQLYKIEVKFFPLESASGGGCRAGVFVIRGERVIIVFAGLHEHINDACTSTTDQQRMLEILRDNYKELYDLIC